MIILPMPCVVDVSFLEIEHLEVTNTQSFSICLEMAEDYQRESEREREKKKSMRFHEPPNSALKEPYLLFIFP